MLPRPCQRDAALQCSRIYSRITARHFPCSLLKRCITATGRPDKLFKGVFGKCWQLDQPSRAVILISQCWPDSQPSLIRGDLVGDGPGIARGDLRYDCTHGAVADRGRNDCFACGCAWGFGAKHPGNSSGRHRRSACARTFDATSSHGRRDSCTFRSDAATRRVGITSVAGRGSHPDAT